MRLKALFYELFPYGHPKFNELCIQQAALHSVKNQGYAEGGQPLGNFERVSAIMANYPNFPAFTCEGVLMMYVMKHLDHILWDICHGRVPPDDACADIAVYMTILRCMITE